MTEREQFEAWADERPYDLHRVPTGQYESHATESAWDGWQASRRAALEESAKVCDELADGWNQTAQGATDGRYDFMAEAGDRCADEIRALSSGETE